MYQNGEVNHLKLVFMENVTLVIHDSSFWMFEWHFSKQNFAIRGLDLPIVGCQLIFVGKPHHLPIFLESNSQNFPRTAALRAWSGWFLAMRRLNAPTRVGDMISWRKRSQERWPGPRSLWTDTLKMVPSIMATCLGFRPTFSLNNFKLTFNWINLMLDQLLLSLLTELFTIFWHHFLPVNRPGHVKPQSEYFAPFSPNCGLPIDFIGHFDDCGRWFPSFFFHEWNSDQKIHVNPHLHPQKLGRGRDISPFAIFFGHRISRDSKVRLSTSWRIGRDSWHLISAMPPTHHFPTIWGSTQQKARWQHPKKVVFVTLTGVRRIRRSKNKSWV